MKKKEPGRENQKLRDWAGGVIEVKGPAGGWAFGDWLTGYAASGQAEHLQRQESYLSFARFAEVTPQEGVASAWAWKVISALEYLGMKKHYYTHMFLSKI